MKPCQASPVFTHFLFSLIYLFPPLSRPSQPRSPSHQGHNLGHSWEALPPHLLPNLALKTVYTYFFSLFTSINKKALSLEAQIMTANIFKKIFMATLAAYGSSQARDQIRAAATAYTTATATSDLSHICDLYCRL